MGKLGYSHNDIFMVYAGLGYGGSAFEGNSVLDYENDEDIGLAFEAGVEARLLPFFGLRASFSQIRPNNRPDASFLSVSAFITF